ncbi:MAG TPA: FAD-dependent oxidoreductase [Balneolales bacterium]|nr:FAD-dependent oxidoreductase [Balneolales bacterium]
MSFQKLNIVLVGGGHAMLPVVEYSGKWREKGHKITLVSDHRWLYYSGMIPEYIGGVYNEDQIRIDLARLAEKNDVVFLEARASNVAPESKVLKLNNGTTLTYDLLVFDIGTIPPRESGFSGEGIVPSKPLHKIRMLADFIANSTKHPGELLIVGGGAAGVEVALNVSGRLCDQIRTGDFSLHVYERAERLLPDFPSPMSKYVYRLLSKRGVRIHFESTFEPQGESGESSRMIFWATGTGGNPIFSEGGLPVDSSGFMRVNRTLQSINDPFILGAGDCISIDGIRSLRKIGVHAVKQGPLLAGNLDMLISVLEAEKDPGRQNFRHTDRTPSTHSFFQPEGAKGFGWLDLYGFIIK